MSNRSESDHPVVMETRGIQRTFSSPEGAIPVLQGVDLAITAGESVSIRGESGAGKTTLLSILAGMEKADGGEILWNGIALHERSNNWQARQRSAFLGLIFQAYYLIPEINALQNVLFPARLLRRTPTKADQQRAQDLLARVGLSQRKSHLPSQLSGGERQRVGIARAMMNNPRLILADEPTGNLDERTADEVITVLLELIAEEQRSLLLVTHNPEFAARTDRQLTLTLGRLEAS